MCLNKFLQGGEVDNQLQEIFQSAVKEIQSGKIGKGVQAILQIASDPQGSEQLRQLAEQNPQIGEIINAALQMAQLQESVASEEHGGCITCAKSKVLMRHGGKLVEVTVDCHGNIVRAKKGCKVKKGLLGLADGLKKDYLGGPKTGLEAAGTEVKGPYTYYDAESGKWMQQRYDDTKGGWLDAAEVADFTGDTGTLADGYVSQYFDPATGEMVTKTWDGNRKGWTINRNKDLYNKGYSYNATAGNGVYDNEANAVAALGRERFNSLYDPSSSLKRWGSLTGTRGNAALGTTSADITAELAVGELGFRGALREARDINTAKRRAQWKDLQSALRNTYTPGFDASSVGKGTATVDGSVYYKDDAGNWADENGNALAAGKTATEDMYGSAGELRRAIRAQHKTDRAARRSEYAADSASIIRTYLNNNRSKVTGTAGTAGSIVGGKKTSTSTPDVTTNTVLKKNGGWLKKYQPGGSVAQSEGFSKLFDSNFILLGGREYKMQHAPTRIDPKKRKYYSEGRSPFLAEAGDAIAAFTIPEHYSSDPNKITSLYDSSTFSAAPVARFKGNNHTGVYITRSGDPDVLYNNGDLTKVPSGYKISMNPAGEYIIVPETFDKSKHDAWWLDETSETTTSNETTQKSSSNTASASSSKAPAKSSWKEQYNAGKTTYNGYTKAQALAIQQEMRAALKNGFKPTKDWGKDDGYFGRDTSAAYKEYQAWKAKQPSGKPTASTQNGRYTDDGGWEVQNSDGTWVAPQESDNPMLAQMYAQNVNDVAAEPTAKENFVTNTVRTFGTQTPGSAEGHKEGDSKTVNGKYYVWSNGRWVEIKDDYEPTSDASPNIDVEGSGKSTITSTHEGDSSPLDYNYMNNAITDLYIQRNLQAEKDQQKLKRLLSNVKISR